jgi:magnesium transporter
VIPTRAFILADLSHKVEQIMSRPVVSVTGDATVEEALEEFAMHRLLALPVLDEQGRLIGAVDVQVYTEGMFDLAEGHRATDLFQLIGLSAELARHRSTLVGFRLRMPWLAFNLVGGLVCAVIAWIFGTALEQVLLLSLFIPLVLTLSESISMQSMTLSLQLLHGAGVPWRTLRQRLVTEWRTAAVLGLFCALVVGGAAMLWGQGWGPPTVIATSIVLAMTSAATLGVLLPAAVHYARMDPTVASGPLVLMLGDIIAMTVYLGLATAWLV